MEEETGSSDPMEVVDIKSSDEDQLVEDDASDKSSATSSSPSSSGESDFLLVESPQKFLQASHPMLAEYGKAHRRKVSKVVRFCCNSTLDDGWTLETFSWGQASS